MGTAGWDRVYQQQGQVQSQVLPKVIAVSARFKAAGYRSILDLACGTGRHSIYLASQGFHVFAGDISSSGIAIAKQGATLGQCDVAFAKLDMNSIPVRPETFDAVLCVWSIDSGRLADIRKRIDEVFRVLRPGGTLVADFISVADETFGRGKQIETNTFVGAMEGLTDLMEHYSTREELSGLLTRFHSTVIQENDHYYFDRSGQSHVIKALDVEAVK